MASDEQYIPLQQLPSAHETEAQSSADYFTLPSRILSFEDEFDDEDDIYRGEPLQPSSPPRTPRPESVSSSSSSSSDSSVFGGRLGAISGIVERAISHWAKAWNSSSSLTDSSSTSSMSSQPSVVTTSRSFLTRRRRRRTSGSDVQIARSELEVHARIRARAEARQVPREFILYTPQTSDSPMGRGKARPARDHDGVLRTTSLPEIISELSLALKDNQRFRRAQYALKDSTLASHGNNTYTPPDEGMTVPPLLVHDYMLPDQGASTSHIRLLENGRGRQRGRKGKQRAALSERTPGPVKITKVPSDSEMDQAWWLDVASPTWEDMRAIGKVFKILLHAVSMPNAHVYCSYCIFIL